MALDELAARVDASRAKRPIDWNLRVMLANFVRGLTQPGAAREGFEDRLEKWERRLPPAPIRVNLTTLRGQLKIVLSKNIKDRHFLATGRPITCSLDHRAVVVVTHDAIRAWAGEKARHAMPDEHELGRLRDHCAMLGSRADHGGNTLGLPHREIWLTPSTGEIELRLDQARHLSATGRLKAHDAQYCAVADAVRELLGLSQYRNRTCLIAAVTRRTIRELLVTPPGPRKKAVMGPSVLEGGTHRRWRHWPEDYGKTYKLDSGAMDAGAQEAVRRPLPLAEVEQFVFLGAVTRAYREGDEAFARAIGVTDDVPHLLERLHAIVGP